MKKYAPDDVTSNEIFVRDGYVLFKNVYPKKLIDETRNLFFKWYKQLDEAAKKKKIERDVNGWAISILEKYEKSHLYEEFITNNNMITIMQRYLGPDLCILGYDALWINVPQDKDPVLLKAPHTDAWTGTSIHTVFAKTFVTDCDEYNGMCVAPGSHVQGLIPVRNREVDPMYKIKFDLLNLDTAKAGDVLVWHALLIHSTTGHSDKNIRMSITSRYTSTETPFSTQERALGYRTLSVGPMNQIMRLVGNDQLQPLRTLGGFVGVDRRMKKIYNHSNYKVDVDYSSYLKD